MSIKLAPASQGTAFHVVVAAHVEPFLSRLRISGYAEKTTSAKRSVLVPLCRWLDTEGVRAEGFDEGSASTFVDRLPRRRRYRRSLERTTLRLFLRYLRQEGVVPTPPPPIDSSPGADLERRYVHHLRHERGLAERSVCVYQPFVHDFLADWAARTGSVSPAALEAQTVRDFLLDRARGRSRMFVHLLGCSLRSFLRFLFLSGETRVDFALGVPRVQTWRQAPAHVFLSRDEIDRVLGGVNQSTPNGRRDHAILLLLVRLGLRAGEIAALELDDIDWRAGEIVVRGKGRMRSRLPLLADVGSALALYLQRDRGLSTSRRIFLRIWAPHEGLAGPAAVGHIVRRALKISGVQRRRRGAAHLFRHTLATQMIQHGASIPEIAEVLRHRSLGTTQIYAKVAFESLRGVARPWPTTGGAP